MTHYALATAYRFHRTNGRNATAAVVAAKRDVATGKERFNMIPGLGDTGERGGRWSDEPEAMGLRFVGWSDELAERGVTHSGWFLDAEMQDEVARGCVYATPSRRGVPTYIEAVRIGSTDRQGRNWTDQVAGALLFPKASHKGTPGGYNHDASDDVGARSAAYGADREAQIYGEAESDYQARYRDGQRLAESLERAAELRASARASLAEVRGLVVAAPALCARLRDSIAADLETAREIYRKALDAWSDDDAFTEGAGFPSLAAARKESAR